MALYITGPVAESKPRQLAIAFDQLTWNFSIVANGEVISLSPDASHSLILEIERAVFAGRKRASDNGNAGE